MIQMHPVTLAAFVDELEKIALSPETRGRAAAMGSNQLMDIKQRMSPDAQRYLGNPLSDAKMRRIRQIHTFEGGGPLGVGQIASARDAKNTFAGIGVSKTGRPLPPKASGGRKLLKSFGRLFWR